QGQVGLKMYKFGQEALSITNVEEVNTIKAFPNPTKDILTLNLLNKENYSLTVFSALGQQIPLKIKNNQLDFSNLSSGIYVVSIKNNIQNKTTHFKIIKQ
ncbi:T9SS type A sorting domain-containing protein, partial [Flavobacterium filum]